MNSKKKMREIISHKKELGSEKKPKYGTRKLSVGLVSCMLGFSLIIAPSSSKADEESNDIAAYETVDTENIEDTEAPADNTAEETVEENKEAPQAVNYSADENAPEVNTEAPTEEAAPVDELKEEKEAAKVSLEKDFDKLENPTKTLDQYKEDIDNAQTSEAINAVLVEVRAEIEAEKA